MTDRTAVLLGASGLVGGHVLRLLAAGQRWSRVVALDRRPLPTPAGSTSGPDVQRHVVDFDRLTEHAGELDCDDLFCCLGTTRKAAGSDDAFRRVDLEIPAQAARLAASNGASQMLIVTAWGADPESRLLYTRTKGEVEQEVRKVGFEAVQILRPSLLAGDRDEVRWGERVGLAVGNALGPLLRGPLAPLRPIEADAVARAMVEIGAACPTGARSYGPAALRTWATSGED